MARLTRRKLLILSGSVAVSGALGWRRFSGYEAGAASIGPLKHLSARSAVVLQSIVDTILPRSADHDPMKLARHVRTIDGLLSACHPEDVSRMGTLLQSVEHLTLVFGVRFGRFTRLDAPARARVLQDWRTSRLADCRLGYRSLVSLSFLAAYSDAASFASIGYPGPVVPGWHGPPESRARYDALLAPLTSAPAW